VGGDVDKFQIKYLTQIHEINYRESLITEDADVLMGMRKDSTVLIDKRINSRRTSDMRIPGAYEGKRKNKLPES